MRKLRVGNDFWQSFQIKEKGVIVDLLQVKDTVQVFAKVGDKCFEVPKEMIQIKEDGIITMEVKTELFNIVGRYEIIVKYWHHDISMSDQDRKQAVNFMPFAIVGKTEIADSSEDIPIVGDIIIGLKGDSAFEIWNIKNGGNNTYDDWLAFLQSPATEIEGIVSANEAIRIENENTRKLNEIERKQSEETRLQNESARVAAEIDREENEDTRSLNEAARLTNEDDRIENENQRVIDEEKREQLYGNAVILKGEVETLKTETETAKDNAITATNQINTVVIPNAELATQNAIDVKTDYETVVKPDMIAKANYAQEQGDYAKQEALAVADIVIETKGNALTIEEVTAQAIVALQNRIIALEKLITEGLLGNIEIMNLDIIENFNIWGKSNLILTGNTPPNVIPDFVGQTFIDTANKVAYTATGINSVNDWK